MNRLNSLEDTINKKQMLFGINQGAIYDDIRIEHAKRIREMDLDGYAVGGLAVGESHEEMYDILGPEHLRLYLMEYQGEAIAGAITIYYGDKMWYLYGASSNRERNRMPNYLMQWEMIQWAVEKGCRIYDFRGVTGDMEKTFLDGLIRFKAGFGAVQDDFVGKMDMIFMPKRAELIEIVQTMYRSIVRRIGVLKNRRK